MDQHGIHSLVGDRLRYCCVIRAGRLSKVCLARWGETWQTSSSQPARSAAWFGLVARGALHQLPLLIPPPHTVEGGVSYRADITHGCFADSTRVFHECSLIVTPGHFGISTSTSRRKSDGNHYAPCCHLPLLRIHLVCQHF